MNKGARWPFHRDKSSSFNNKKLNKYLLGERDIWLVAQGKRCTTPVSHYELIKHLSSYWLAWPNEKHLRVLLFHLSLWKWPFNCKTSDNAAESFLRCVFCCRPVLFPMWITKQRTSFTFSFLWLFALISPVSPTAENLLCVRQAMDQIKD